VVKLKPEWGNLVMGLAIVAALWFLMGLHVYLAIALTVVTAASALVGGVAGSVIWGIGLIGIAGLAWLHFGAQRLAIVLAIIGVIYLALSAARKQG